MKPRVYNSDKKLTEEDLRQFETELKIKLPESYKVFLLENNGGFSEPEFFIVPKNISKSRNYYIVDKFNPLKYLTNIGLENIFRIAHDPGDNMICICVSGKDTGKIFYATHEADWEEDPDYNDLVLIANNFDEFINGFDYDPEANEIELIIQKGSVKELETKLKGGLNINSMTTNGYSLLSYAIYKKKPKLVKLLLLKGAELKTDYIEMAIFSHNLEVLEQLAEFDFARVNKVLPLNYAANFWTAEPVIRFLIEKGFDVNAKTEDGKTALDIAKEKLQSEPDYYPTHKEGFSKIIDALRAAGAKESQ